MFDIAWAHYNNFDHKNTNNHIEKIGEFHGCKKKHKNKIEKIRIKDLKEEQIKNMIDLNIRIV